MTDDDQKHPDGEPTDETPTTRKPRSGGPPKGSCNHLTHGATTDPELDRKRAEDPNLPAKKRKAAKRRVALREQIKERKAELVKAMGAEDDPMLMEILDTLDHPKYVLGRIDPYLDSKFFDKHGNPSASVDTFLAAADKLTGRLEHLARTYMDQRQGEQTVTVKVHRDNNDPEWFPGWARQLHEAGELPVNIVFRDGTYLERNAPDEAVDAAEATMRAPAAPEAPAPKPTAQERLSEAGKLDDDQDENPPPPRRNPDAWKRWCDGEDID